MPTLAAALRSELKIAVEPRVGLIEDISGIIARSRIPIANFHTETQRNGRSAVYRIELTTPDEKKIQNILGKIKKTKGVKEIGYKLL